ncbi:helix-turn-helix domain-containing protein [Flavivirga algicola]|uniref:Helix-turn-helix transcriptional regulator n=1 Tax=Flavivirga algicola TaxID=2729136 RepID=A0ABX1RSH1_9FLAO|nr:AraC family transcriptional regulator [Flavivirga algicola]NMH86018.1 helix-turn-helix transcriptional regulator [Flavivirga algicola]
MSNQFQSLKLKLINVGYNKLDHNWNFDNVISPFTRLYLITKGDAYVYHNKRKFHLRPNNMYLIPSYTYSSYKCHLKHEQYYISFFEELGSGLSIYNFMNFKYEVKASELDKVCFERLVALNSNRHLINYDPEHYDNYPVLLSFEKKNTELSASNYLETHGIIKLLMSKFIDTNTLSGKLNNANLDRVLYYISENLHENLTLTILADYCNMSKDHFSRSFKKYYGLRPTKYIQNRRLERFLLLLITTNYSVREIAHKIGFENYTYFLRYFKERIGKTPAEFRKERMIV